MTNLLYKELRLVLHPMMVVFLLMGVLLLIPGYPYSMVFFFGTLAVFQTFLGARESGDVFFTVSLPISRRDAVKARCALLAVFQLGQLSLAIPFAMVRGQLPIPSNPVGMEANVAWFGAGLMIYALFNWVFLTQFYKTAHQVGAAYLLGCVPVAIGMLAVEVLAHIPALAPWLDSVAPEDMVRQVPILLVGLVWYGLGMVLTYRTAANRFARVDL